MATVRELINDALVELGVVAADTPLEDSDALIGFRELNRMLGTWSNNRTMIYEVREITLALTAGLATYSTSLLPIRPVRLEDQKIVDGNDVSYPLAVIPYSLYTSLAYTPAPGIPYYLLIQPSFPQNTLTFYPTPIGDLTAYLYCWGHLTAYSSINTTVALPPGYEDCIVKNLAIRCAPSFRTQASAETTEGAREALRGVMSANLPDDQLSVAFVPGGRGSSFNWYSGEVV